jgi:hypothetical protein
MNSWNGPPQTSGGGGGGRGQEGGSNGGKGARTEEDGVNKKEVKPSPVAKTAPRQPLSASADAEVNDLPTILPPPAAKIVRERLAFLKLKVKTDGEPSLPQLGAFLRSVVTALHLALEEGTFDMEAALGWSYNTNRSLPNRPPPSVGDVVRWLRAPTYTPVIAVSFKEFSLRSESDQLSSLLAEYGDYDPDWNKPEPAPVNSN